MDIAVAIILGWAITMLGGMIGYVMSGRSSGYIIGQIAVCVGIVLISGWYTFA